MDRYARQRLLPFLGEEGQKRLEQSAILVVGCGATGSHIASLAARVGVGRIVLVDRDIVELHNLPRQVLFEEEDVLRERPKALALRDRIRSINSSVEVEAYVGEFHPGNGEELCRGVQLIFDGTDNFQTRFLINELGLKLRLPWVYMGVISTVGHVMPILPFKGPCLRCYLSEEPRAGELETCDTVGVWAGAVSLVSAIGFTEGVRILLGDSPSFRGLFTFDIWSFQWRVLGLKRDRECLNCGRGEYRYLGPRGSWAEVERVCGEDVVCVRLGVFSYLELMERLKRCGEVKEGEYFFKFRSEEGREFTIFSDGRVLVFGTQDFQKARSWCARYIGL